MPSVKFVIEEIQLGTSNDPGIAAPATQPGVRFEWDTINRAMPREGWPGGVKVRSKREEDPGSDEVVEQVLGPSWKPFTLRGEWDDRFGGERFAQSQLDAFTKLVQRCNLATLTMGAETITGLITDFDFVRMRVREAPGLNGGQSGDWWRIAYSFAVSPHYKLPGGDVRQQMQPAPQTSKSAASYQQAIEKDFATCADAHAMAPRTALVGKTFAIVDAVMSNLSTAIDRSSVAVDSRIVGGATSTPTNATGLAPAGSRRGVQAFSDVALYALALRDQARALDPATALAYETAAAMTGFVAWAGGLQSAAILLAADAQAAATDLARRLTPDAIAIYAPSSGELLATISTRYYRTPHRWRDIMHRNGLRSPVLTGDEQFLVIPR